MHYRQSLPLAPAYLMVFKEVGIATSLASSRIILFFQGKDGQKITDRIHEKMM